MKDVTDIVKPHCPKHWKVKAWTDYISISGNVMRGTTIHVYIPDLNVTLGFIIEPYPHEPAFEKTIKMTIQRGKFKERQWIEQHPQS